MRNITNILVVIAPEGKQTNALRRAIQIAQTCNARLEILNPNQDHDTQPSQEFETLCAALKQQGIDTQLHETSFRTLTEAIIHIQQTEDCQLVIKDADPKSSLMQTLTTPQDWRLLRECTAPVLLVKHDQEWDHAPIIAAINADEDNYDHLQLNHAILDCSAAIADYFSAEMHIASAYPTARQPIEDHGNGVTFKQRYEETCKKYAQELHLGENNIHLHPDFPETLIASQVNKQQARLLIMGTHARTGISALAIGNTAEQLIAQINTDILVVHP